MNPPIRGRKILFVSEFFYPHWTGIAKTFLRYAQWYASEGALVKVLTSRYSQKLKPQEMVGEIEIFRSKCLLHISRTYYSLHMLWDFTKVARDVDVVIINSPCSNILFVTLLARCLQKKVVIYHQGDLKLPRKTGNVLLHVGIEKIFDFLTITAMSLAHQVATYTKDYAEQSRVMKHFPQKCVASMPPFQNDTIEQEADGLFLQKLNELRTKYSLVGFAGRFVEEKGFDILLKALPEIVQSCPDVCFLFAGETDIAYENFFEMNQQLLECQKEHVHMLGLLSGEELNAFYKALSVYVVSSRSDCFPVTQIEAVKAGVPSVCTDIPGARALVLSSGFGEIVTPENPQELATAILRVVQNRESYDSHYDKAMNFLNTFENVRID